MDHLQSMKVFVRVADLGSFARAASSMDISNAVATRHVADLEGRLGTRLLNRTTRSLSLTESGQVYIERARQILDELEDVEQMVVARNHEPVGTLRLVAPVVFGLHNLAPVLQTYIEQFPKVVPDVTLVDRQVDLVEEGFDIGIVIARQMRSASIVTRRLTTGCMTVCATPGYLETHGMPTRPEHLLEHPCLSLPSEYWGDERVFTGPDGEVRVRPSNVIAANNTEMLRQFALLGMGIAILPSYLIGQDMTQGKLVRLLGNYRLPQVEINIAYPSRRHLPAKVRTFIDHLVEHFGQTPNGLLGEQWIKDGMVHPGLGAAHNPGSPVAPAQAAFDNTGAESGQAEHEQPLTPTPAPKKSAPSRVAAVSSL
ncbi:LysR family transcriptional regulator [Paraburkholderia bonniea]|uniref:LysR family transcriptional regulator n=1 Tax=Paraburkholderia bonniea TaxID=2152891 RepID=UPI0012923446|nr:LysR family transcriptional regulator [Paraburkholderia bonniea]WJF90131.1 LysR family transcriptional regulator [Paraburkholderia bonniea]WJF93445.1 LysR family transcriptional regulator [Paraburkholderia bonniea]